MNNAFWISQGSQENLEEEEIKREKGVHAESDGHEKRWEHQSLMSPPTASSALPPILTVFEILKKPFAQGRDFLVCDLRIKLWEGIT